MFAITRIGINICYAPQVGRPTQSYHNRARLDIKAAGSDNRRLKAARSPAWCGRCLRQIRQGIPLETTRSSHHRHARPHGHGPATSPAGPRTAAGRIRGACLCRGQRRTDGRRAGTRGHSRPRHRPPLVCRSGDVVAIGAPCKRARPESIQAWQAAGRAYGAAAARCCGVRRLVAVWREVPSNRGPLPAAIDRYVGRRAATVVAAFPAVRDYCIEQGIAGGKNPSHPQRRVPGGPQRRHAGADPRSARPAGIGPLDRLGRAAGGGPRRERRHLGGRSAESDPRRRPPADLRRGAAPRPARPLPRPGRDRRQGPFSRRARRPAGISAQPRSVLVHPP